MTDEKKSAELKLPNGKVIQLPIVTGSEGEQAVDITKLRSETGFISFDPGYANTGACQSRITFVDGEKGILRYRGIPIEELAKKSSFLETSYLLIYGELPQKDQLKNFSNSITRHMLIPEDMKRFYDGFPRDAHPMAILSSVVAACFAFYEDDWSDLTNRELQDITFLRLLAKLPTMSAFAYKKSIGEPFIYPTNSLSYCANFLNMMFSTPAQPYELDDEIVSILDMLLILHADHEQNCSTSTVRLVGSSLANLYACVSAGISALWGPLHGGANQKVIEMLWSIWKSGNSVQKCVEMAKDKNRGFRLFGFGHRVYKIYDPRATILKDACARVLAKTNHNNPLMDIALELEAIAIKDDYFISRNLYPNVDFYSGIIYSALNIPVRSFTAMFAFGRLPGWIAQWREMINTEETKLGRPRQIYIGENQRPYIPVESR